MLLIQYSIVSVILAVARIGIIFIAGQFTISHHSLA